MVGRRASAGGGGKRAFDPDKVDVAMAALPRVVQARRRRRVVKQALSSLRQPVPLGLHFLQRRRRRLRMERWRFGRWESVARRVQAAFGSLLLSGQP